MQFFFCLYYEVNTEHFPHLHPPQRGDTNLLGVYAYRISIGENAFDTGAAIAIVMVLITVLLTLLYMRSMLKEDM